VGAPFVPFDAVPRAVPIGGGTIETHITAPGEMTRPTASGLPIGTPSLGTGDHVEDAVFASGGSGPKETRLPGTPDLIPVEPQRLVQGSGIKETRLPDAGHSVAGQPAGIVAALPYDQPYDPARDPANAPNAIHLGHENEAQVAAADGPPRGSRLTLKHYLGAAAVIVVLMVAGAVALIANVVLKPRQQAPTGVNPKAQTITSPQNSQVMSQPMTSPEAQGSNLPDTGLVAPQTNDPEAPDKSKRASKPQPSQPQPGDATATAPAIVAPTATPAPATAHSAPASRPATTTKSASNGDSASTGKEEKKKGLFGKIKDKVVQPFKHDSDQKKQ
jgi:hypothetical protein